MRQGVSVLMLAAGSTLKKLLGLFVIMAAAQSTLFYFALQKSLDGEPVGLEQLISQSRMAIVAGVGFLLLCALLSLTACEIGGSKLRYTMHRLSIPERTTVLLWAGHNAVCFFLFWIVQLGIAFLLCRLYVTEMGGSAYVSKQTILLAFYRNSFLHSLLPLAETSRYIRNGILAICLGICAACFSFRQRHDKKGIAVVVLAALTVVSFSQAMGSLAIDIFLSLVALSIAAGALIGVWRVGSYENEL
ncbi:MAG: hypothetical protein GX060_07270 [Firmicutes bacterium]|nr:hypothetical protein [Bacillota bacterium]